MAPTASPTSSTRTGLAVPPEKVVGRHLREVLGANAFELIRPRLDRALRGERVFFEQDMPYASGSREVAVHYIPDIDASGEVHGCFALIEDISARKRAERALREADRRKDDFLAILGHELRNPLTSIRNVAHVLSRGTADGTTVRRSGELLERQANHLSHLVDDLLDVASIMRGRIALDLVPMQLGSAVETAVDSLRSQFEARGQKVALNRDAGELSVAADSIRLSQVISNLLANASRYSPDGSEIHVSLEATGNDAMLSVRDQGMGIDPQMLPRVFDQFLQGDRSLDRFHGGLGIGLTVVKHLVEMHGGRVEARSEGLGEGSEFRVYLPRVEAAPALSPGAPGGAARLSVRRRVLIVDDNRDAAESLRELLRLQRTRSRGGARRVERAEQAGRLPRRRRAAGHRACRAWMDSWWRTRFARASHTRTFVRGCWHSRVTRARKTAPRPCVRASTDT